MAESFSIINVHHGCSLVHNFLQPSTSSPRYRRLPQHHPSNLYLRQPCIHPPLTAIINTLIIKENRWVLRAEPLLSCWPNLLFLFISYYFIFFFLSWVGLSQHSTADLILIIIIIILLRGSLTFKFYIFIIQFREKCSKQNMKKTF